MELLRMLFDLLAEALVSPFGILCLLWAIVLQILIFRSTKEKTHAVDASPPLRRRHSRFYRFDPSV